MMELIQPVTELLNDQYAAVGIMEEWKASISLFQAALDLPNFDWAKVSGASPTTRFKGVFADEVHNLFSRLLKKKITRR